MEYDMIGEEHTAVGPKDSESETSNRKSSGASEMSKKVNDPVVMDVGEKLFKGSWL